jgi:hypothetical protein
LRQLWRKPTLNFNTQHLVELQKFPKPKSLGKVDEKDCRLALTSHDKRMAG